MNAFCILFSDSFKHYEIGGFVKNRTLASLPVACRYRMIDFILSYLVKANVPNIGIITTNNYNSLMDHVGWGKDWDLNRKNSGLKILPPMATTNVSVIRNKFDALSNAMPYMDTMLQDYCIIADSNIICNVDFKKMLEFHESNNADFTVAYVKRKPLAGEVEIMIDEKNRAYNSLFHPYGTEQEANTILKITMVHKEILKNTILKGTSEGWEDLVKDYIAKNFNRLNVYAYEIEGYSAVINSLDSYYKFNMDLLNEEIAKEIFLSDTEILTRLRDSAPTLYGKKAEVLNSMLADGCRIDGKVENSILFRDVIIEEGAEVKNSILMSGTVIKKGAKLEYVITDKDVKINEDKYLKGDIKCQFTVPKGKII